MNADELGPCGRCGGAVLTSREHYAGGGRWVCIERVRSRSTRTTAAPPSPTPARTTPHPRAVEELASVGLKVKDSKTPPTRPGQPLSFSVACGPERAVSLDLLERLDRHVARMKSNRSAVVGAAIRFYLDATDHSSRANGSKA